MQSLTQNKKKINPQKTVGHNISPMKAGEKKIGNNFLLVKLSGYAVYVYHCNMLNKKSMYNAIEQAPYTN